MTLIYFGNPFTEACIFNIRLRMEFPVCQMCNKIARKYIYKIMKITTTFDMYTYFICKNNCMHLICIIVMMICTKYTKADLVKKKQHLIGYFLLHRYIKKTI